MLGNTELSAVLGCGVNPTDHKAVRAYIRAACDAGLSLLLIVPGTKVPYDGRTPRKRSADDRAAQNAARDTGRRDWQKVRSPSGLALASSDKAVVLKYLDRYIEVFGKIEDHSHSGDGFGVDPGDKCVMCLQSCAVNLAVEVGGSNLVVVDADTVAQRRRFLGAWQGDPDSQVPPTILSPGTRGPDGEWVHEPGNGHYWFTTTDLPYEWEKPTNMGAYTLPGDDGFAVLWDRRYVLIPPSRRPEGAYESLGRDYPLPKWLADAITSAAEGKAERAESKKEFFYGDLKNSVDAWAETVSWRDILEPLGWTPTARPDSCGCDVWTASGEHASPKSATAHDSGCTLGRYTETNAPLHIWTDNPGPPFGDYVEKVGTKTLSKLQAVAWIDYEGDVGRAMDALGLTPQPVTMPSSAGTIDPSGIGSEDVDFSNLLHDMAEEGRELKEAVFGPKDEEPQHVSESETLFGENPQNFSGDSGDEVPGWEGFTPNMSDIGPVNDAYFAAKAKHETEQQSSESEPQDEPDPNTAFQEMVSTTEDLGLYDEEEEPDLDVFDAGIPGVPVIARFSHWRHTPPPEYIVDGLLENGGLSSIIGPHGMGKSSIALDLLCHIATGRHWQGRRTLKTRVLYLMGEGRSGAVQRLRAWEEVHKVEESLMDDVYLGDSIIQLGAANTSWEMLAGYIVEQKIGLIVFDTFARMAAKLDENSATDVGLAILRFDQMRRLTGAGLMVVHHTAKGDSTSSRGSTALPGAVDSELLVSKGTWEFGELGVSGQEPDGRKIQVWTSKQKNAEQLETPIPLLMRSYKTDSIDAPYITGVNGEIDPMAGGGITLARPAPEQDVETAIRIAGFISQFPEQGATRADIAAGVRPDAFTAMRADAARAWRQKVAVAVDRALHYQLIETASGQRLGTRYVPGQGTPESARHARAAEVIGETNG